MRKSPFFGGFAALSIAILASGCSSAPPAPALDEAASSVCPKRAPAAFQRAAIRCEKHFGTGTLNIGALHQRDEGQISGFVYHASCHSGDIYLENYPMTAIVDKNEADECIVSLKKSKKIKSEDSVSFELTLKSASATEGRFPASVKVSLALDHGRVSVVDEVLDCEVLYDLVQTLGCKVIKK